MNNLQITRQEHTNVPPSYAEMESPFWSWKNTVWRLPHFRNRNCAVSICAHSTARNRKSPFFSQFKGFYRPRQQVADTAYEKLYAWLGNPSYRPRCFLVPYRKNTE
ncbi:MAG: hypothetical protein V8T87_06110 [Victivallales bacterium]